MNARSFFNQGPLSRRKDRVQNNAQTDSFLCRRGAKIGTTHGPEQYSNRFFSLRKGRQNREFEGSGRPSNIKLSQMKCQTRVTRDWGRR